MTPCSRGRVVLTVSPTTTNQEVLAVSAILHTFLRAANIHILKITSTVYKPIWRLLHVAKCDRLIKTMASKPLRRVMLLMTPWGMIQMYLLPHYIHHIWGHSKSPSLFYHLKTPRAGLRMKFCEVVDSLNSLPKNAWKKSEEEREYLRGMLERAMIMGFILT